MTRPIGVLRPEPGNAATAARIEALGLVALRLPLFAVRALDWEVPSGERYDGLLVTSANAFRHGGAELDRLKALPVHVVGEATAEAARAAGFAVVQTGSGGIDDMRIDGTLLHLAGREHRALPGVDVVALYASDPLNPDLMPLIGGVALLHSPRAAARLAELVADRSDIAIAAISAAARDVAGDGWRAIAVADATTDVALVAAARGLAD